MMDDDAAEIARATRAEKRATRQVDIAERLREHAYRVAGGSTSEPTYDPETLEVECDAADEIERLRALLTKAREDIYWMLNNRQFLNADVFDYLDQGGE